MVDGYEAICLRVACRDFLRKVVFTARTVARPSLWVSVIWGEGRIMSGFQQPLSPLTPLPLGSVHKGEWNQDARTMKGGDDFLSN